MKRAKPYKVLLVLAVVVAGGICMCLPKKSAMPVTNVSEVMQNIQIQFDTLTEISFDSIYVE